MINFGQLKKISEKPWFYPVALLLIGFVTYNYALTSLGYYWADWEIVMFTKLNPALQFNFYAHSKRIESFEIFSRNFNIFMQRLFAQVQHM